MPKRRRSDSGQHRLEREARQRAAEAELTGLRDGAPDHLTGNVRRNFVSPVIRLVRGAARLVRRTIRVTDRAPDVDGSPTIASMTNKLVVLGGWLVHGDDAFVGFSDRTVEGYRHLVSVVQAEWEAERKSRSLPTGVRWSRGTERDNEVGQLVAVLSGGSVPADKWPYRFERYLEAVSRRQATAATLTENLRGGAPDHLAGDDRRNFLCPAVRLQRETATLVRRMNLLAASAQYGYRGDPHTVASMANLLLFGGGWLVFRDEAFDGIAPGAREKYIEQAESLRATRLIEADLLSGRSTAGVRSVPSATPPIVAAVWKEAVRWWAAKLGIEIKWTDEVLNYFPEKRVLAILTKSNDADQVAAILIGMAAAAPSINKLSDSRRGVASVLAGRGFAERLKISELLAMRGDELEWPKPDDFPNLGVPVQEAVTWVWDGFCQFLPPALSELTGATRPTAPGSAP